MSHIRRLLATAAIGLVIAACLSNPGPSVPSANPAADPTSAPSAAPIASPSIPVVSAEPSEAPSALPATGPSPSPSPAPSLTAAERQLVDALGVDARIGCAPRRTDLPAHATTGVECRIGSALVDRVGIYSFDTQLDVDPALAAYLDRLALSNIAPRSGDCQAGAAGDSSWPDYLPDAQDDGSEGYSALRSGCFLDENATANVRLTCYGSLYVGVLGKNADIAGLYRWAWRIADGESTHRDPPGICAVPD
jgi:hypothetical protein